MYTSNNQKFKMSLNFIYNGKDAKSLRYINYANDSRTFDNLSHIKYLDIPLVNDDTDATKIFFVLAVGTMNVFNNNPCVTIRENNKKKIYLLPEQLSDWVQGCINNSFMGLNIFPANVKLYKLKNNEYHVKIQYEKNMFGIHVNSNIVYDNVELMMKK